MRSYGSVALAVLMALALGLPGAVMAQSSDEEILAESSSGGTESAPRADEEEELSTTYSSIGLQKISTDFENVEDAVNLDITMIGFRIPTAPWFGVELNLGFTMIPGEIKPTTSEGGGGGGVFCPPICDDGGGSTSSGGGDFGVTTIGAFGVLRSTGKFFAMGKIGYRYINSNVEFFNEDRTGDAYGAGIGYRWNRKGSYAELGYTKWSDDLEGLGFSVSYSYNRR